jgi:hypothetical protein
LAEVAVAASVPPLELWLLLFLLGGEQAAAATAANARVAVSVTALVHNVFIFDLRVGRPVTAHATL